MLYMLTIYMYSLVCYRNLLSYPFILLYTGYIHSGEIKILNNGRGGRDGGGKGRDPPYLRSPRRCLHLLQVTVEMKSEAVSFPSVSLCNFRSVHFDVINQMNRYFTTGTGSPQSRSPTQEVVRLIANRLIVNND